MKYLLTYRSVPDFGPVADEHFQAHVDYLKDFAERGELLMMGPLLEPSNGDGIGVFSNRQAAEEFVAGDPLVIHGVIGTHEIRAWKEVLVPEPAQAG